MSRWRLPRKLFQGPAYEGSDGFLSEEADGEKLNLRMQAFKLMPHETVLDLYAGKGFLAWLYGKHCRRLICVEKDPAYFKVLKRNLAEFRHVELYNCDNLKFLAGKLRRDERLTFVDFDAYGIPALQIQRFFQAYPIRHALIIALTDGLILNFRRLSNADLRKYYLQDFPVENPGEICSIQELGEYCFHIQRQLIDILAMKYEAQAWPLYFKVNSRCTAAYSAYMVLPKIVGAADFKRYVGLRRVKYGAKSKK